MQKGRRKGKEGQLDKRREGRSGEVEGGGNHEWRREREMEELDRKRKAGRGGGEDKGELRGEKGGRKERKVG